MTTNTSNTNSTQSTPNASYVRTCQTIAEALRKAGIPLLPQKLTIDGFAGNKDWACFQRQDNGHKVYVKRTGGILHTTLNIDPSTPGYVAPKDNGKIAAHFANDVRLIEEHLLPLFIGQVDRLRDSRPATRKPASATPVGSMADVLSE